MIVQHKQSIGSQSAPEMHNRQAINHQQHLAAQHQQPDPNYYAGECQYGGQQQMSVGEQVYQPVEPHPQHQHQQQPHLAGHQMSQQQQQHQQPNRYNQQYQQHEHLNMQAQPPVPQPPPISQEQNQAYQPQHHHHQPAVYEQQVVGPPPQPQPQQPPQAPPVQVNVQVQQQQQPVNYLNSEPTMMQQQMVQRTQPQIHHNQRQPVNNHSQPQHRISPYSMAASNLPQQPVRAIAGAAVGRPPQMQYGNNIKQARPMVDQCNQLGQPLTAPHPQAIPIRQQQQQQHHQQTNYQINGYEEFPPGPPTLLQQQLNRQPRPAPQMQANTAPRFVQQVQKRQNRLEDSLLEQQQPQQQHYEPQVVPQNTQGASRLQFYPQQQQQQQIVKPIGAQMNRQQPRHLEHQHQQPHLLGNPTPPLTPTNARCIQQQQQQPPPQHIHQQQKQPIQQQPATDSQWHHHNGDHMQLSSPSISSFATSPTMHNHNQPIMNQHHVNDGNIAQTNNNIAASSRVQTMPKNHNNNIFQQQQFHHQQGANHHAAVSHMAQPMQHQTNHQPDVSQVPMVPNSINAGNSCRLPQEPQIQQIRLTLPLNELPVLGPFRLDHDTQLTSKVFHLTPHLFDTLGKSMSLINPQTATSVQELQLRAYVVKTATSSTQSNSLLASNHHNHHHHNNNHHLQQAHQTSRQCNWPEFFQANINQTPINLDKSKAPSHRAADIFQFCRLGDNILDIHVKDCYCSHEFVIEAVDRPTLKAFMNSCFKSRMLSIDGCLQKFKFNYGSPGFLIQNQQLQQAAGIFNEYFNEFIPNMEQTKAKVSLRCPITYRRMRTPTRGQNCKHLQCFDLESFLFNNKERSQWYCPLCNLAIPFTMLELDQHQINIVQAMSEILNTDDIILDGSGQWQTYYGPSSTTTVSQSASAITLQQQTTKSTGIYHSPQQSTMNGGSSPISIVSQQPMRPMSGPILVNSNRSQIVPPANGINQNWTDHHPPHDRLNSSPMSSSQPIRRPASAMNNQACGLRSANGSPLIKKQCVNPVQYPQATQVSHPNLLTQNEVGKSNGAYFANGNQSGQPIAQQQQTFSSLDTGDDLSPLAAMERTIIQHEQQMGPPPFDPSSLTSSPMRSSTSTTTVAIPAGSTIGQQAGSLISPNQQNNPATLLQKSPESNRTSSTSATAFSPATQHGVSSPVTTRTIVPTSPSSQQQQPPPQSPMHQQTIGQQQQQNISTPNTPSMLIHNGPETPATPSNSTVCNNNNPTNATQISNTHGHISHGVDHQPLSNGSASAASITSTSTMTPSGQSLGSVGMGGDSRCGTAPLQTGNGQHGLDDLMIAGNGSQSAYSSTSSSIGANQYGNSKQLVSNGQSTTRDLEDKSEILLSKLMMDQGESLLRDHQHGRDLTIALEEAEWKQQLDRGKSEHLANFLNDPSLRKHKQQYQMHNNITLAGSPNPSEEDGNSSPNQNVDQFANYLDADGVDSGAGLPPDDSILDLFER